MILTMAQPLASIVVITYNSSKYVLETLESIKSQTYKNIELIISDDCSADNTVELTRSWLEANKSRFVRTELITVDKNTGIAPNCNRGCQAVRGNWIKLVAGDDLLLDNCIFDNIAFINSSTDNPQIVYSDIKVIDESSHCIGDIAISGFFSLASVKDQYQSLLTGFFGFAPSCFFSRRLYESVGGYDEQFPFLEDYPFAYKVSKSGNYFYSFPIATVAYRTGGISSNRVSKIIDVRLLKSILLFYRRVLFKDRAFSYPIQTWHDILVFIKWSVGYYCFNNRRSILFNLFAKALDFFDIHFWLCKLRK